jgi:4-hydroxy-2-oxoheptanedioate aldolase
VSGGALRRAWHGGGVTLGVGLTMPSPAVTRLVAVAGFDWVFVDLEHGAIGPESAHAMILATAGTGAAPLVRVPATRPWTTTPLDWGAAGLVHPMVETAADAASAVAVAHYPPAGDRPWGPFHAPARLGLSTPDYLAAADDEIVTVVIVETPAGIERIGEIVSVPGVDAAVIGSHDLAMAMGYPGRPDHPDVTDAVGRAERVIRDSPVALGGNAFSADQARAMIDRGYQLVALGFDTTLVQRGAAQALDGIVTG